MKRFDILVTSCENPDIDGLACSIAYAKLLRALGKNAQAVLFGEPLDETKFAIEKFKVPLPPDGASLLEPHIPVVLVDTSTIVEARVLNITPDQVVEIIDHRQLNDSNKFLNAKVQLELVGSCTTLVAERFFKAGIDPSPKTAALLYLGTVSNTINFRSPMTTSRDKDVAQRLLRLFNAPEGLVQELFSKKSMAARENIRKTLEDDKSVRTLGGKKLIITQLEITGVDELFRTRKAELVKIHQEIKKTNGCDYILLNAIDTEKAFNRILVVDDETERLLTRFLDLHFHSREAKTNSIIMRKVIAGKLRDALQ